MNVSFGRLAQFSPAAIVLFTITACGEGSSTPATASVPPPASMFSIGGTVFGMASGQSAILMNNGGNNLTVNVNGQFTFAAKVVDGGQYAVTVIAPAGKSCTVSNGSGKATSNVTNVAVDCRSEAPPSFSFAGTVSGLVGHGLVLALETSAPHGGRPVLATIAIDGNGKFAFPLQLGTRFYEVVIEQQPGEPSQQCVLSSAVASQGSAQVTDIEVRCGEFAYVLSTAADTISAFSVDAGSGTLAAAGAPVRTGRAPKAIAGTADKRFVYVANSGSNDVSGFAVDPDTGALTEVPGSPFAAGTGPDALALTPFPDYLLYVANAGSNDIYVFQVNSVTGRLTPSQFSKYQTGADPTMMAIAPGGYELFTASASGSSQISAFQINGPGLMPVYGPAGGNVSSMAFGNGFGYLYVANASGSSATISGFNVDAGVITKLPGFPLSLPSCRFILSDRSEQYLYALTGTGLVAYHIETYTGVLTVLAGFPLAVDAHASSMSIDPANHSLYVSNGAAKTVSGFALDSATGALSALPGPPFALDVAADLVATF
jgi:6-phosphogluconolactonase (cycloisomerase 2 family)